MSAPPEGIRTKGRDLQSLLKRGAANFLRRPIEPEALLAEKPLGHKKPQLTGQSDVVRLSSFELFAEEVLRKSEKLFAAFMDHSPGFAWIKDLEGRYVYANKTLEQLGPYREGWLGKTDGDLWPAGIAATYRTTDETVIATRKALQTVEPYLLDGEACSALVSKFPILDSSGAVEMVGGVGIDITEALKAEQAQAELVAIVEFSDDAIISETLDGVIVSWNAAAEKIYGYSASEAIGRSITILALPEQHDEISKILKRIERGKSIEHFETTSLRKDGSQISISMTISPIKNSKGKITGASTIARDTSEQERAKHALRESEIRFRQIAENINEVFWVWTAHQNARLLYVSPAYETIWGRSCESLYSSPQSWREALHPKDKEWVLAEIANQDLKTASDVTYRIVRPNQSVRWIRDRIFPVRDASGAVVRFAGIAEDITKSKEAEEALNTANQRLRILSRRRIQVQEDERRRLSRELHDQIGQLLTAGNTNLQSARRSRSRRAITNMLDKTIALLDQILQQVRQISFDIWPPVLDDLGLAPAMHWMLDDTITRAGLSGEFFADPNLKRGDEESETACYRVGLEAVANVVRHAHARKVWLELRNDGEALQLLVRDDGIGFDVAAAEKRVRRDRLGLVGMHDRATAVGGQFECKSTPGHGTEVRAFFPVSSKRDRIEPM